jgi:hypothetical protein
MEDSIHKAWKEKIFEINYFGYKKKLLYTIILMSFHQSSMDPPPFTIILVEYK